MNFIKYNFDTKNYIFENLQIFKLKKKYFIILYYLFYKVC